jgi:ABC-2 type transport system permease protein
MKKVIQIAIKDFQQTMKTPMSVVWMLVLPLVFTGFFGLVFGGFGSAQEESIPVGILSDSPISDLQVPLQSEMESTTPIEWLNYENEALLRQDVLDGNLSGGIIIPEKLNIDDLTSRVKSIFLIADVTTSAGTAVEANLRKAINRLILSNQIAEVVVSTVDQAYPHTTSETESDAELEVRTLAQSALQSPVVTIQSEAAVLSSTDLSELESSYDQAAPGMLVQFTINSVIGTAVVIVMERRTKTLERLLTNSLSTTQVLAGHALYIFAMAVFQQSMLVIGGQLLFGVNYLQNPFGIWLIILTFSLWITGLGMLIGVTAKNNEQVILFSLLAMFLFTALAGAWFPLEGTSPAFYRIGHFTPGAWVMDGLQNIIVRGLGFNSVLKPAGILILFALVFLGLALLAFWLEWRRAR